MAKRKITINGMTYPSLKEAAKYFGVNPLKVSNRLRMGWGIDEAFELKKRIPPKCKRGNPISVMTSKGLKHYESVKEAADSFGLDARTVRARLTVYGWSPEMALGLVQPKKRKVHNRIPVDIIVEGVRYKYPSVSEAAKAMDLSEFLVFCRMNRDGWSIEEALELVPPQEHTKKCYGYIYVATNTINGKQYVGKTMRNVENRWKEHVLFANQETEVNKNSLSAAIVKYGDDAFSFLQVAKALTYAELNKLERYWIKKLNTIFPKGYNLTRGGSGLSFGLPIMVDGINYPSIADAARKYGFKDSLIPERLRYGWSVEQAFELVPPPETHKFTGRNIEVNTGKNVLKFNSIADMARHFDLPFPRVLQRLVRLNWTPEEAVGLAPPRKWVHPKHSLTLTINGKVRHFRSRSEAAKKYGFKRWETIRKRLKRGWSLEQALGINASPENKYKQKKIRVVINGKEVVYNSQIEAAEAYGISFKKVSARIKLGWSFEEALGIVPRKRKK